MNRQMTWGRTMAGVAAVALMGWGGMALAQEAAPAAQPPAKPEADANAVPAVAAPAAVVPAAETVPASVADAAAGGDAKKGDELIDMKISDGTNLRDILRTLFQMRPNVNLIMGPEIQGTVGLELKKVTWDEGVRLVAESNGMVITQDGPAIYRVTKADAKGRSDVVIELLKKADVANIPKEDMIRLGMALHPGAQLTESQTKAEVERMEGKFLKTLQVENRPAIEVVNELAKKAGLNFAFSVELSGSAAAVPPGAPGAPGPVAVTLPPISLHLRYISVDDALKLVAAQGGLSCLPQNGVWVVKPLPAQQVQQEPLKTETIVVKFLPVDEDLMKVITKFLSDRGKVSFNKNKIVIRDTAESIEGVRGALVVMDVPTPQVLIEARFFELQKGASKQLGVDWNALGADGVTVNASPLNLSRTKTTTNSLQTNGATSSGTNTATQSTSQDVGTGVITGTTGSVNQTVNNLPATILDTRAEIIQSVRSATLDVGQLGIVLHALQGNSGAKQLSNPKIVVSSDQQATIHIGDQTPIVKSTTASSSGGGAVKSFELDGDYGGETAQEEQLVSGQSKGPAAKSYTTRKGYLDLGTKLSVAPSVKTEDQIYIKVVPQLTSLIRYESYGSGDSLVRYPVLFSTEVRTEFTIRSGQTIAIGGLVNERDSTTHSQVPILGSIPLLKRLFSYDTTERTQTETIIFLTVKVVTPEKINVTTGVPVRATLVQAEIERIQREDAEGAEYSSKRATQAIKQQADEEKDKQWNTRLKRALGMQPAPEAKPAEPAATPAK